MMQPYWLLAIPIVLLLLWLAWRRPNRQRLAWRLLASVVAGVSLVLLVFPPVTQQAISPGTAILLTEGFEADSLEAVLQKLEAEPQVYAYQTASEAKAISSMAELRQLQPGLETVHVLGYGLQHEELEQLKQLQLKPHLTPAQAGVRSVSWPQSIKLGEAVEVAGKYTSEKESIKLYLHVAGKARDSVELAADSTHTFRLRYTPNVQGRHTYTLLAGNDTLGQVPVQVTPHQQLGILLLSSAPSFEFKFLKNHLAGQQHRVAFRASVSKDISQSEWLNMPKTDLSRITPKLLQQFDVVITEPQALQSMSAGQRAALQRAVTEDGLGVLTIATEPANSRSASFFTDFQGKRLSQQDTRSTRAEWPGREANTASAAPYTLANTTAVTGLIAEQGNSLLAGAKKAGWGKVALSYLPQTFPWVLEGKDKVYASYWAALLSAIAKEQVKEKFWQLEKPQAPHPNQPAVLSFTDYTLATAPTATVTNLADSTSINLPLAQQVYQPEKYSATFWPRSSGWHKVETANAAPYFFYVQDTSDWEFESVATRRAATQAFATHQSINPAGAAVAFKTEPLPLIWFFVLFALSSAFLWLEEKF
ncbi:hypothetical protein [Pontibacter anaerobius]|uniref:Aerotolerance regulator N-terminal domain-containing protein n=1 Tax=Pontibacter anaerobius TaxID=2993940 RepID=A0ABT3RFT9_9BACT|nr:hypothetical protein [Pontibacter anaerobius]MCX2740693.1 hypothetical protein [Pontibacter anaerobius]